MKNVFGWIAFIAGWLVLLGNTLLITFSMRWTPGWFIAAVLIVAGFILLKVSIRAIIGLLFAVLTISDLSFVIVEQRYITLLGAILFGVLAYLLLKRGLFDTPKTAVKRTTT